MRGAPHVRAHLAAYSKIVHSPITATVLIITHSKLEVQKITRTIRYFTIMLLHVCAAMEYQRRFLLNLNLETGIKVTSEV